MLDLKILPQQSFHHHYVNSQQYVRGHSAGSPCYINDINKNIMYITSLKLGLFADDCVIYKTIYNKDDSIALQKDRSALSYWARIWQVNFNVDKCI